MFRRSVLLATLLFGAPSQLLAASAPKAELKYYVGRVEIIPENRSDVQITVVQGKNNFPIPTITQEGANVVLDGGLKPKGSLGGISYSWYSDKSDKGQIKLKNYPPVDFKDLPVITVRTPMAVALDTNGVGIGHIGPSESVEFNNSGSSDWTVAPITGELSLSSSGSGNVKMQTAGKTVISMAGSGDIVIGKTDSLSSTLAGSGDIVIGTVDGLAKISLAGSGDVRLKSVKGDIDISIAGSGDVTIAEGEAASFKASIMGSGDVKFGGTAGSLHASIVGSGDIRVAKVTGNVKKSIIGSGDIHIGQ